MFPKNPDDKPVLEVQPESIDFGNFHPNAPLTDQPAAEIIVTNTGTGILQGRLVPSVSWLIPQPIAFFCKPGESSRHRIHLSTGAPIDSYRQDYNFEEILLATSNAGEHWFSCSYHKSKRSIVPGKPSMIWLLIPAALLVVAAIIFIFAIRSPNSTNGAVPQAQEAERIFTEAAKTLYANMTSTAILAPATVVPATQASIIIPLPTQETTSEFDPTATFTPWPQQDLPNPEQFIKDYYQAVDQGDYAKSWGMLSAGFQETCCQVAGNDPFVIYTHFWDNVDSITVLSAYLQNWNTNPAEVYVTLEYQHSRGDTFEEFHVFYIVANPQGTDLLIDQVQ
jgi:hypothetical protein